MFPKSDKLADDTTELKSRVTTALENLMMNDSCRMLEVAAGVWIEGD